LTRAEYLLGVQTQNEDFVYDKLGNRTTLKHNGTDVARYQHNDVNEYTYIGLACGTNVTHDDAGNMTGDHDGYTYHYDYENRLTRVKKSNDTVDVAVYTYDALGRRIAVEDCIADTTTHYYYDGWRVLTETDENDDRQRDFAYGNYLDEALIMTVDASPDVDHYYAHDHLFSPVAIVDSSGDIQEYYQYDAYGKCTIYTAGTDGIWYNSDDAPQTTSTVGNPIFFTGQRLDELDSGDLLIMYYKNRYYLVDIGRFITRDPLGMRDGICIVEFARTGMPVFPRTHNTFGQYTNGMNIYEYVRSIPTKYYDSFGLFCAKKKIFEGSMIHTTPDIQKGGTAVKTTMEYKVSLEYGCAGQNNTQTWNYQPKVVSYNVKGRPDRIGIAVFVVGVSVEDKVEIDSLTIGTPCPDPDARGVVSTVYIFLYWKEYEYVGVSIGIGPFSADTGLGFKQTKTVMSKTLRHTFSCCCPGNNACKEKTK